MDQHERDRLRREAVALLSLLDDPQPALPAWGGMVDDCRIALALPPPPVADGEEVEGYTVHRTDKDGIELWTSRGIACRHIPAGWTRESISAFLLGRAEGKAEGRAEGAEEMRRRFREMIGAAPNPNRRDAP
jgi:hypothetical protein